MASSVITRRSRDLIAAAIVLIVAVGGACAWWRLPASDDTAEAAAEFKAGLPAETRQINSMIADTKAGKNVSDFRLGMFAMNLLNQLSEQDDGLGAYFHKGGRLMEDYLTDVFQYHSEEEMARIDAMTHEGNEAVRVSARDALESLRHIPVDKDPPDVQAKDRNALVKSLTQLNQSLARVGGQ